MNRFLSRSPSTLLAATLAACAALFAAGTADAQTTISGGNVINQTWTTAGSPYTVQGDIIVPAGAFLTIESGVEVRFTTTDALAANSDTARVELIVRGQLTVNGTAGSPVRFRSTTGTAAGSWVGLIVESGATSASIQGAIIEHAANGLRTSLPGLTLTDSTVRTNANGLLIAAGNPTLANITATGNSTGIRVETAGALSLQGCLLTGNTTGIEVLQSAGSAASSAAGCTIDAQTSVGVLTNSAAGGVFNLSNSIVTNGGSYGVYRQSSGTFNVTYSDVWNNPSGNTFNLTLGTGCFNANPLFVSATNRRLTSNSPARFAGMSGEDLGFLPYVSDATVGLLGTLWVNTTLPSGTNTLLGDLTVAPGVTLTVPAGATVSAATTDQMRAYTDTSRVELRVFGTLIAVGTSGSPITFTSAGTAAGSWYGVEFQSTAPAGSRIEQAVIEEAASGIHHRSTAAQIVRETTFRTNANGLLIATGTPTLANLTGTNNATAIRVESTGALALVGCLLTGNTTGIEVLQNASSAASSAAGCTIDAQTSVGVLTNSAAGGVFNLSNSIVTNGGSYGVYRQSSGTFNVTYSDVWNNPSGNTFNLTLGTGCFNANPLFVSATNRRLTSNSPARFAGMSGEDLGFLPYVSDATVGLLGTLWVNTTLPSGTNTLLGDLTVAPGVTLTVPAGATVSAATTDQMRAYTDTSRVELRVFGTLIAVGTSGSPITFTSAGTAAGSWYGVEFQSSAPAGSRIEYAVFEEAASGLHHRSTAAQIVRDVTFRTNANGLLIAAGTPALENLTGTNNSTAIRVESAGALALANCLLTGNTTGIEVLQNAGSAPSNASGCTIDAQTSVGVLTNSASGGVFNLSNSIVTNGGSYGVYRQSGGTFNVTYSDVWNNPSGNTFNLTLGTGCFSANPQYVAPTDRHLQPSSVAIDVGTATGAPAFDLERRTRPLNGDGLGGAAHDLGAYEYAPLVFCGDGIVQSGETCDSGASNGSYGACNSTCTGLGARCGDGTVNGPEACDDGNTSNTDACTNTCVAARCGDGVIRAGTETCDDGNMVNTDACTNTCAAARCGDGFVRAGTETCDDGNTSNGDACTNACNAATCGDGYTWVGVETCDDGNTVNTDACPNSCAGAVCGDGIVQSGEACDDANTVNTDACTNTCASARCGDGFTQTGVEACDDANTVNTDACTNTCVVATCGDGFVQMGVEACDDGNMVNTDACTNLCVLARCGDGIVQSGEACDDGNAIDTDACSNSCRAAACGDGVVQMGEQCDDGNLVPDDACSNACLNARCGDGIRQSGEACDDGNADDTDACTSMCRVAACGDGIVQSGEQCDDGNTVNTDACTASCTTARCGDGVTQLGVEDCDDGNASNTDACVDSCVAAACGDGYLRSGVEACDDGNTVEGDGCTAMCALASCGDGTVQSPEACDDGNASNLDGCLSTCLLASCGDGFRRVGTEACDDGNGDDTDACLTTCQSASCGDGFVQMGVEACDDGNGEDTDACLVTCESAACGDGFVQTGVETCDDANTTPGDGCNASCVREEPMPDGGIPDAGSSDAGSPDMGADDLGVGDAGTGDASALPDTRRDDGGCGCRIAGAATPTHGGARDSSIGFFAVLALLGVVRLTRRRRG